MDRNNLRKNLIYINTCGYIQTMFLVTVWKEWDQTQHYISVFALPPPPFTPSLHPLIPETAEPLYCLLVHIPSLLSAKQSCTWKWSTKLSRAEIAEHLKCVLCHKQLPHNKHRPYGSSIRILLSAEFRPYGSSIRSLLSAKFSTA